MVKLKKAKNKQSGLEVKEVKYKEVEQYDQ